MADNPDRTAARPRPGAHRPHRGRLGLALAAILAVLVALIGLWMAMDSGPFATPGLPVAGPEAPARRGWARKGRGGPGGKHHPARPRPDPPPRAGRLPPARAVAEPLAPTPPALVASGSEEERRMPNKWLRTTECLTFETEGAVAWITLNRPEKRNALSRTLLRELREALLEADDRKAIRCVVLQGAGKDFCAGYDMAASSPGGAPLDGDYDPSLYRRSADAIDDDAWRLERNAADILTIFDLHKPVIAAVHGHCVAGGTDLALACDMVVAAHDARIGFPAVRAQGTPPMHWWIYNVGPQWAKRMLLTGDLISGRDAARINLVLKSVPAAKLREAAGALAQRLALIDADLLAGNKRIVNMAMELMGARTMQRFAAETDARGHLAAAARAFSATAKAEGLSKAFKLRDALFGDGMVRLEEE